MIASSQAAEVASLVKTDYFLAGCLLTVECFLNRIPSSAASTHTGWDHAEPPPGAGSADSSVVHVRACV